MRQSEQNTGRRYSCGKTPKFAGGVIPGILNDFWDNLRNEQEFTYLNYFTTPERVGQ